MDEMKVREALLYFRDTQGATERVMSNENLSMFKEIHEWLLEVCLTAIKALEKQLPKKPICASKRYTEELGFNDEFLCPVCKSYVGYFTEDMREPEQMEYCNNCGQHIAKDWSE